MPTFTVIAHEHPAQVARLAARLGPFPVVVHVSRRVDLTPFRASMAGLSHVTFVPDQDRVAVNWAGYSVVLAIRRVMAAALERTAPDDHIVLLSGADYPLKPVEAFAHYLTEAPFRQHVRYFDVQSSEPHYRRFVDVRHYRDFVLFPEARRGTKIARLNEATKRGLMHLTRWHRPPPWPPGLVPRRGSMWVAVTARCAADVLRATTPEVERRFARTFSPDEMYIHTMVDATGHGLATPAGGPEPSPGRHSSRIANFHVIDDSLTKWFTIDDRQRLEETSQWFVRKVRPGTSDELLDWIDARLGVAPWD